MTVFIKPILSYREDPAVTELHKGYKVLPKGTIRALLSYGTTALNLFIFCIVFVGVALSVVLSAIYFGLNALAAAAILITFALTYLSILFYAPVHEILTSPVSELAVNRGHRAEINKTRAIAKQLGDGVVPLLTKAHINRIMTVHTALLLAREDAGKEPVSSPNDYERLAVLLLEDAKRRSTLLDLIQSREMLSMDDIEEALRDIEDNTTGPVQSGWL